MSTSLKIEALKQGQMIFLSQSLLLLIKYLVYNIEKTVQTLKKIKQIFSNFTSKLKITFLLFFFF